MVLPGVSQLSRMFWLRTVILLPVAVTLHLLLAEAVDLQADIGGVGAFVTAIGTLYSVLTAFTVVSVWTQFIDTDRAVKGEARELGELWRYVGYLSSASGVRAARAAIESYRDALLADEWPAMECGEPAVQAEDDFYRMADAINRIEVQTAKDVPAWTEAVRKLGGVADQRGDRLVLVNQRMPGVLRALLYLATMSLIGGMALLGFDAAWAGAAVVAATVVISLLVLEVIDDIDDPFGGAWGISPDPLRRIRFTENEAAGARHFEPASPHS